MKISSDINLTPIKEGDHANLFALMQEIYTPAYAHFWIDKGDWYLDLCYNEKNLETELADARSHYFFVQYQSLTVGILKYDFPFSPSQVNIPNAMKLHRLYLHPSCHGKGVASEIMDFVEQIAKEEKLDSIWLEAMVKQEQAKRFYQKMGYKLIHSYTLDFENFLPGYENIQILQKKLT